MPSAEATILLHELDKKMDVQRALSEASSKVMTEHIHEDRANFIAVFARLGKVENKLAWWGGGAAVLLVITNIVLAALQVVNILK